MWGLLGCASGPPSLAGAREACGIEAPGAGLPWTRWGAYAGIDEGCAETLGEAVGVSWEALGEEPHAVSEPVTAGDHLLGGLYALIGSDTGTVGDLAARATANRDLLEEPLAAWDAEEEATAFWFAFVEARVKMVRYSSARDCVMSASIYGQANVCDLLDELDYP